jgi:hypothetical protein
VRKGRDLRDRGHSLCQGPEAVRSLACWRSSKDALWLEQETKGERRKREAGRKQGRVCKAL